MSAREILERCRAAGLKVRAEGAELVVLGRPPAELLAALKEHKPAVLNYLRGARTAHVHPCAACGKFAFPDPAFLCYWCRRHTDGRPMGEPCADCGEACVRCLGRPSPPEGR